jgi:uroporphyrin-III C-methyltransferase
LPQTGIRVDMQGGAYTAVFLNGERMAFDARHRAEAKVHIVGAGPGDPELLTLKAVRLIGGADVIFFDRLAGEGWREFARTDARLVDVGKVKSRHTVPQPDIATLMIDAARAGLNVVRLKGGDPFVFGRGGEELEALQAAGIDADITPGISAALAAGAASGIPLTHRDKAQVLTFVTGHGKDGEPDLPWETLAARNQTLVIYMGVETASRTAHRLIAAGRDGATPAAIVENASRPHQRVIRTRLDRLGADVAAEGINGPAILIVGEVAGTRDLAPVLAAPSRSWLDLAFLPHADAGAGI